MEIHTDITARHPATSPARQIYWTNSSVLALGSEDPVQAFRDRVHRLVLNAIEGGWSGPPYDPFALADHLGLEVTPSQSVIEARTVPVGNRFRIEYNPNRGMNRARYSVAHEIAHTLFPDCADAIRHRQAYHRGDGDNWQLEMLCNIGAAEIIMPVGSGLECPLSLDDFTTILELREKYKVSTEALLLRMSRLCGLSIFAASFVENRKEPLINYSVADHRTGRIAAGTHLPASSVIADCTAIGFTAEGTEKWPSIGPVHVQCVGVPPYPGQVRPRVLGVFRTADFSPTTSASITYVRGDATEPRGNGRRIIVQIVNDKALTWGGGLSLSVRRKWPTAQKDYSSWAGSRNLRLGNVHFSHATENISIASIVAQAGYGPSVRPRVRYGALEDGLRRVAQLAREIDASVHMPRLGCGEAGGSWSIVGELLETTILGSGILATVYDLPGKGAPSKEDVQLGLFAR